jgi:SAM-dependent methyltransferase
MAKKALKTVEAKPLLKLDIGCGKRPKEGFDGVDIRDFGQKHTFNAGVDKWPFEDGSVEEAHCSHFVEHLTATERIHFVNELHRVLIPGGKASIICPHWGSNRAYGDLTHQWPPVSEMWFYYLSKAWRTDQAPHNDAYTCDFDATWGYSLHPSLSSRNQEYQMHAMNFWKESCQDIIATLTKKRAGKCPVCSSLIYSSRGHSRL